MNIIQWEQKNAELLRKIAIFQDNYEQKLDFNNNYASACRKLGKATGKKFGKEISNQIKDLLNIKSSL